MSKIGEFILRKLSRHPEIADFVNEDYELKHRDVNFYKEALNKTFPSLSKMISNKKVLDVGCSEGMETLALSMLGAHEVFGIDIRIDNKKNHVIQQQYPNNRMKFSVMDAHNTTFSNETFDAIVTCGSFEHFDSPYLILKEFQRILKIDGRIYLTSGVWAHPWGAHMNFFTRVPWVQFIFSESTIMNVRSLYRNDGAQRFNEVEGGLNKIGIREFNKIVKDLNYEIEYLKLNPVKGLTPLTRIPYINELFTNLIIAILKKCICSVNYVSACSDYTAKSLS